MFAQLRLLKHYDSWLASVFVLLNKGSEFFTPFQLGLACPSGAEKNILGLRSCVDNHWLHGDFSVMKIDLRYAFNLVSGQAVLDAVNLYFPELCLWSTWYYGQYPIVGHTLGSITLGQN